MKHDADAKFADVMDEHERVERLEEHGQDWLMCSACGATWSVVQCESSTGEEYEDLEDIDQGDGSCCEVKP